MTPLYRAFSVIWSSGRSALLRGLLLTCLVLAMGAALLGVSGWFITATGAAGMAGIGIAFDVFRPSAAIRFLALGRAASRYGERLLTHDATLRALAALRVDVLRRHLALPFATQNRLRIGPVLTRVTADVDALDGLLLRLVLPGIAFVVIHVGIALILGALAGWSIALPVLLGQGLGGAAILVRTGLRTRAPSTHGERAMQRLRTGLIDLLRGQTDAVVFGTLDAWRLRLLRLVARGDEQQDRLERADRDSEAGLSLLATGVGAVVLVAGHTLVSGGSTTPAMAAIGIFVALAVQEATMALRRGVADFGRMQDAAARLFPASPGVDPATPSRAPAPPEASRAPISAATLVAQGVTFRRPGAAAPVIDGFNLSVEAGETLALTGPSGCGKSTILHLLAGLDRASNGTVWLRGHPINTLSEPALRADLCLVPQRATLVAGTVLDNLRLARAEVSPQTAETALDSVCLLEKITSLGGVEATLGESGTGLSGGETRRLVLARALLRAPRVLLLDEPTEGLDQATAARVLQGIRRHLPEAAIVLAAHRPTEISFADHHTSL